MFIKHPRAWLRTVQPVVAASAKVEKTGPWRSPSPAKQEPLQSWLWLAYGRRLLLQFPRVVGTVFQSPGLGATAWVPGPSC